MSGPRQPLYWSGARLVELYSVGPLSEGIGLNLTVWSYCDRLYCALLACHEQVPDPHAIAAGLHDELRALLDAAASLSDQVTAAGIGQSVRSPFTVSSDGADEMRRAPAKAQSGRATRSRSVRSKD